MMSCNKFKIWCVAARGISIYIKHRPGDVVVEYYQQQEEMLEGFTEMDTVSERGFLPGMSKEEREKVARSERIAIRLSNLANVVLFAAKIFASIKSGSLAIIASTLDSLLDLLSGFILWFTACKMRKPNPYIYPIGKKCMQPLVSPLYFFCLNFVLYTPYATIIMISLIKFAVIHPI